MNMEKEATSKMFPANSCSAKIDVSPLKRITIVLELPPPTITHTPTCTNPNCDDDCHCLPRVEFLRRHSVQAIERWNARAIERPSERAIERPSDRATERPSDRAIERPSDRAIERPSER